ncbi:PAAR domain-containing protein [Pseudomonas reidholzensis]|nr:PAAR domain-containing protein [Pseudomonas reidholzensis]
MKGRGQALDGDFTTTGAICIASTSIFKVNGRRVLREGDVTTPCPRCNKSGTVVEGMAGFMVDGRRAAMDGARVACGCDDGCRVIAPLGALTPPRAQPVATPSSAAPSPKSPELSLPATNRASPLLRRTSWSRGSTSFRAVCRTSRSWLTSVTRKRACRIRCCNG